MKKLLYICAILSLVVAVPVIQTGCANNPSHQYVEVQTLKALGQSAKTGMDAATQLLKQGSITVEKWHDIARFYDSRWQPAYAVAVSAAHSDLSSIASPDLVNLAAQLALLVSQLQNTP